MEAEMDTNEEIYFSVIGEPKPQGSKRAMPIRRGDGSFVMKDGRALTRVVDDNPKTANWKQEVAHAARQVYAGPLLSGPVQLTLIFYRPRPQTHYGTGRNAERLKDSAPPYPTQRPDTLKLARAVEDALTGVLWRDDAQIVRHALSKHWGVCFRVDVIVGRAEKGGE